MRGENILSLKSVHYYWGNLRILENISLDVLRGEVILVRGRSGVGKSTLAKISSLIVDPTSGSISFLGNDTRKMGEGRKSSLRLKYISYLDQEYSLINNLTIMENILLPIKLQHKGKVPGIIREKITELVNLFNIRGLEDKYPDQVSGGQRQRAALLRSFLKKPFLLVLDEPTSAQDEDNERTILRYIREYTVKNNSGALIFTTQIEPDKYIELQPTREYMLIEGKIKPCKKQ